MGKPTIIIGSVLYLLLWIPAFLLASAVSFLGGYVSSGFAPVLGWAPFLLALPAILLGFKSFRLSAALSLLLMILEVSTENWPHFILTDLWASGIDAAFLALTVLAVLVAVLSPYPSINMFFRQIRES